ncbi:MAG: division/cell wall cluster transcriptional repressor MraZ [Anaerolineae bacterium]
MFLGEFEHSIDEKGRLTIPAKFRPGLAEGMVITRGLDGCLWVFPTEEWAKVAEKISRLPLTNPDARDFARLMFSGAAEVAPDRMGRVLVPAYLREYAHMDTDAVVIGLNWRLEIWNRDLWRERRSRVEADADAIGQHMAELDLGI